LKRAEPAAATAGSELRSGVGTAAQIGDYTVTIAEIRGPRNLRRAPVLRSAVLDELVERAAGEPIYVTTNTVDFNRPFAAAPLASLRSSYPSAMFVWSRGLYPGAADWRRRWPVECKRYAAAIVVTFAPWAGDPYGGLAGDHVIGSGTWIEIRGLQRLGRPILWQANEFPAVFNISRFSVEVLPEVTRVRMARLIPHSNAKPFSPLTYSPFGSASASETGP